MSDAIGEIVEVSTASFVAHCLRAAGDEQTGLIDPPALGSFVKITPPDYSAALDSSGDEPDPFVSSRQADIYAIVSSACTASVLQGRRPAALGYADEAELRLHQPQIFELLTTEFSGIVVAYRTTSGAIQRHIPPVPPRIHRPVHICTEVEVVALTQNVSFLRTIINTANSPQGGCSPDALVAACLRSAHSAHNGSNDFLVDAGRRLFDMMEGNYDRLQAIIDDVIG
ncbi:MAG: hypothetical protein P4L33_14825 [Capsulimonadaceae bacterium]|nr:hypothetical protein [Capsulimonadaceae bacterium]